MLPAIRSGIPAVLTVAVLGCASAASAAVAPPTPDRTIGFDGKVFATCYVGSTLYLGGEFLNAIVGGRKVPRAHLAAIDVRSGALLDWAPTTNATVRAMTAAGSWL